MEFPAQNPNQNIQNTTGTYYVASNPTAQEPPKGLKGFLLLEVGIAELIGILLILALFFEALNFFNLLSLSSLYPKQLGWLPHLTSKTNKPNPTNNSISVPSQTQNFSEPKHDAATDTWSATGILVQYNDNLIKLKTGNETLNLVYSYQQSSFYKKVQVVNENASAGANFQNVLYTLYDLDKKENLGKTYEVIYITDKSDQNVIQSITEK